jgi:hypothetical protein
MVTRNVKSRRGKERMFKASYTPEDVELLVEVGEANGGESGLPRGRFFAPH